MNKRPKKISAMIRREGKKDTGIGHLISFFYYAFSNNFVVLILSLFAPTLLSILLAIKAYSAVAVFAGIYLVMILLIAWAQNHLRQKSHDTAIFQEALSNLTSTYSAISRDIAITASQIKKEKPITKKSIKNMLNKVNFQSVAFYVCEKLRGTLEKCDISSSDDLCITVYQRINDNTCKMIAYAATNEPENFEIVYGIPSESDAKLESESIHIFCFAKNRRNPIYVRDTEYPHQVIAIPITADSSGTICVVLLKSAHSGFFGETESEMTELFNNTIRPFTRFLQMKYEDARLIEQIINRGGFK